jgi:putative two-component system response regulator
VNQVLVVDDHETNLKLYARVVTQIPGSSSNAFTSAKSALRWAETNDVSLVLVDQEMPELSGIDFIRAFRELRGRGDVPIIMITGTPDKEVRRSAVQSGASAFLTKPVDPVEFIALAQNFMVMHNLKRDALVRAENLQTQLRALQSVIDAKDAEVIETLERVMEVRDQRLADHCKRTALYAEAIARKLRIASQDVARIALAARVHDIGKLSIPDRTLLKPTRLSDAERRTVQGHPAAGAALFRERESPLLNLAAQIALGHHERLDGRGYPGGLKGEQIPYAARIVAVADAFSALTSQRPYREALSVGLALDEIERGAGDHFEPRIITALRDAMPEVLEARARYPDLASA